MARFGFADRWMYRFPIEPRWYGLSDVRRREVLGTADLLVNVSGTLERPAEYGTIPRLAYIDSDPVFTQVKLALQRGQSAFKKRVALHNVFFSFGERIASTRVPQTASTGARHASRSCSPNGARRSRRATCSRR